MSRSLHSTDAALALTLLANSRAELGALAGRLEAVHEVWARDLEHLPRADAYAALVLLSQATQRAVADRLEGVLAVWARTSIQPLGALTATTSHPKEDHTMRSSTHRFALTSLYLAAAATCFAGVAAAQTPLLEVEKSDATKLLQVTDDAGFVVRGTLGSGTIPAAGAGVRLMWYPGKVAFRAGRANGSQWDDGSIGAGSVALGDGVVASGPSAVALGYNNSATGSVSLALNSGTKASGVSSIAGGLGSTASGQTSLAVGYEVVASGTEAVALGSKTVAGGANSLAAGFLTTATGRGSVALGSSVTVQGDGSFAFGDRNTQFPVTAGPNEFLVRAFGGIGLNTGVNIG
ncbi:MAG: hypothetical protein ACREOF_11005, partial [Gemmatimonadales bacterium]